MAQCKTAVSSLLTHWRCCVVQDFSISSANALEILQSCTKVWIWNHKNPKKLEENMSNFVVIDVPANALALFGARVSAATEVKI